MKPSRDRCTVLVADDDAVIRGNLALLLRSEGYTVVEAEDGVRAGKALADPAVALALLDLKMPGRDGMDVLRDHKDRLEEVPVIMVTALGGSSAAIEAMRLGAYDYVTKPFDLDEVLFTVRRALTQRSLVAQVKALAASDAEPEADDELIGRSPVMLRVFKTIGRVAATTEPVLVVGESGTGKELVANAVHANSDRAGHPLVKVNCAALSPTLLESDLFGHEKGAFTGAVAQRRGRFEQASGGTLFLDEVGELGIDLQAKLLRVLQAGTFERVGGERTLSVDVRVVAATNRDLPAMIAAGTFREDLYYRLNVVAVELPPLRDRREDIPLLADHIVRRLARKYQWPHLAIAPDAVQALCGHPWPGNVRQMQNVLARAAILARGQAILADDLRLSDPPVSPKIMPPASLCLADILAETERRVITEALAQTRWNRTKAAELMGISRRQLFDKIQEYGLSAPDDRPEAG
jgi:DNA-binding NtrC family response regulator